VLVSCGDSRLQQYNQLYSPYVMLLVCVSTMYCDVYQYVYGRTSSKKNVLLYLIDCFLCLCLILRGQPRHEVSICIDLSVRNE
jgi:hypothetical protein